VALSEITNIWDQSPNLVDMKDIRDRNHLFLIKVNKKKQRIYVSRW